MSTSQSTDGGRFERFLEYLFFSGIEFSALSSPMLTVLLFSPWFHPNVTSLSGLFAVAAGALSLALYRGRYVDVGRFPRYGHLPTLLPRAAYYSAVLGAATWGGSYANVSFDSTALGILIPVLVVPICLAFVPKMTTN
ncbi:hypothetical protein ACNS7O_01750 [Haloferacaceae archaeon DSL9]